MQRFVAKLKTRKLGEWVLAYVAAAWLVLQVVDVLGDRWGLTSSMGRGVDVILLLGLLVALVLAWYHGERGEQRVSGPELLIIAGLCALAAIGVRIVAPGGAPVPNPMPVDAQTAAPVPGIAVLPFRSLSTLEEDAHFADGLHASLISALERSTGGALKVIAQQAVLRYRDSAAAPAEIGRDLGVGFLLQGSVQRGGSRVRLAVELVDAGSGAQLWNATQDRVLSPDALFEIQEQVVTGIVGQLQVTLRQEEVRQTSAKTPSYRAADLVQRAVALPCTRAVALLEEAVSIDSSYVTAHAFLGECQSLAWAQIDRSPARREVARRHVEKALELAPEDPDAHLAMVWFLYYTKRWEEALVLLDRTPPSLRSEFKYLEVRSYTARRLGRLEESLALGRRVLELSPGGRHEAQVGFTLLLLGRYQEAIQVFQSDPTGEAHGRPEYLALARWFSSGDLEEIKRGGSVEADFLGWDALMIEENWSGALEALPDTARTNRGSLWYPRPLLEAWALEGAGRQAEARDAFGRALREASARSRIDPDDAQALGAQALASAGLGSNEQAVGLARQAVQMAPVSFDALEGPVHLLHLIAVLVRSGETAESLDRLQEFMALPTVYPPSRLRTEYLLRPLRSSSRFMQLTHGNP